MANPNVRNGRGAGHDGRERLRLIALAGLMVLFAGCASIDSQIKPMVGGPVSAAVNKWGPPDERLGVAGRTFYRWYSTTGNCEWSIEVDQAERIIGYKASGLACPVIGDAK